MTAIHIGISGWRYTPWRGDFYRHGSFIDPAFARLLKRYNTALVIADTTGKWPYREDITSDFVYLRLHGVEGALP